MKKNLWVKIFAVALVLMCVLTLAACNKEEDVPDSNKELAELDKELAEKAEKGETSKGLLFKKTNTAAGEGYLLSGIGECTDSYLIIPATHDGLPVLSIRDRAF